MSRERLIQGILWAAVVAWTILALFLTLQNGTGTAAASNRIAREVHRVLTGFGIIVQYSKLHQALRIAAHFIVFGVFGVLLEAAILTSSQHANILRTCIPALLVCTAISIVPEVLKLWVPGRHLQWDEVLLNVIGAYGGVLGVYMVWRKASKG